MVSLKEKYDTLYSEGIISEKIEDIPLYIKDNLRYPLREYQEMAIYRFLYYMQSKNRLKPTHLLFHMATGSGKTLLMASFILELYKQGYRNFIFFVNATNILEKTKANFLNKLSDKYLFTNVIKYEDKAVEIKEVDNFETVNEKDINIVFTTIQALHTRLNTPKENAITYEDFENKKIVLISDEAHHINSLTKRALTQSEQEETTSWEHTVNRILQSNKENIMLEFTATVDLKHPEVAKKYDDKILYDYSLKQFRKDGFSKEVNVLAADMAPIDRTFQAIILSQYRRKLAEANGILLKPVILVKSQKIKESEEFEKQFLSYINKLTPNMVEEIYHNSRDVIKKAFEYFIERNITFENLIKEIQSDFSENKCRTVNSKEESETLQLEINCLESYNNEIRLIFAVDMLNEGWDVLNLFDIVRNYETRQGGNTTIKEAQLIGRGARYYPFFDPSNASLIKDKRKYDDTNNPLKILEELYYHCYNEPKYISEIKNALKETGIMENTHREVELKVKEGFKNTEFYKKGYLLLNQRIKTQRNGFFSLADYGVDKNDFDYPIRIATNLITKTSIFDERVKLDMSESADVSSKKYKLSDFNINIIRSALDCLEFYKFDNIKQYFPNLSSINDFINNELLSKTIRISGLSSAIQNISNIQKRKLVFYILSEIESMIKKETFEYQGTFDFEPHPISEIVVNKTLRIEKDNDDSDDERLKEWRETKIAELRQIDLFEKDWFVYDTNYGTKEEKLLIKYISDRADDIKAKYEEFYLIRSEKLFKIYNFKDGKPFEPDFVLFVKEKGQKEVSTFQIFIEPKGEHLFEKDKWKEDLLLSIESQGKYIFKLNNMKYKLVGMPFYNEEHKKEKFNNALSKTLNLDL